MPGKHAKLSPSSAHRWLACPGSVAACEGLPDTGSSYADEGTAAHFLASECLASSAFSLSVWVGDDITVTPDGARWGAHPEEGRVIRVDHDMADYISRYVDFVRRQAEGGQLFVEYEVPLTPFTGEPDAFGSVDALIITRDGEIQVHDLKYGQGKVVNVEQNEQLMIYGLGALYAMEPVAEIKSIRLFIHQVRLRNEPSEWEPKIGDDLGILASRVAKIADLIFAGANERNPGEEQCQFCKAAGSCDALALHVAEVVGVNFDDLEAPPPTEEVEGSLTLSSRMDALGLVEGWCKAVRAETERRLLAGVPVPGYKIVRGKQGNRQWSDDKTAEETLKSMRLKVEEMYDLKLISPTTAEKLSKPKGDVKPVIGPRQWDKLQDHITRKPGGLSVAPESDPRPAEPLQAAPDEFDNLV